MCGLMPQTPDRSNIRIFHFHGGPQEDQEFVWTREPVEQKPRLAPLKDEAYWVMKRALVALSAVGQPYKWNYEEMTSNLNPSSPIEDFQNAVRGIAHPKRPRDPEDALWVYEEIMDEVAREWDPFRHLPEQHDDRIFWSIGMHMAYNDALKVNESFNRNTPKPTK